MKQFNKEDIQKHCKKLVKLFAKKQDMTIEFAVVDDWSGVIMLGDYYFSFTDIVLDLHHNAPKHLIFEWYNGALEAHELGKKPKTYESFLKKNKHLLNGKDSKI